MCFDERSSSTQCSAIGAENDFRCDPSQAPLDQVCIPQQGATFARLSPSAFTRGRKATGECCAQREDGLLGQECASNLCMTKNGGPFSCTQGARPVPTARRASRASSSSITRSALPNGTSYTCN